MDFFRRIFKYFSNAKQSSELTTEKNIKKVIIKKNGFYQEANEAILGNKINTSYEIFIEEGKNIIGIGEIFLMTEDSIILSGDEVVRENKENISHSLRRNVFFE